MAVAARTSVTTADAPGRPMVEMPVCRLRERGRRRSMPVDVLFPDDWGLQVAPVAM